MKTIKLPIGQKNVVIKQCKAGYADGVRKPVKVKDRPEASPFNTPVLCIVLRKAA